MKMEKQGMFEAIVLHLEEAMMIVKNQQEVQFINRKYFDMFKHFIGTLNARTQHQIIEDHLNCHDDQEEPFLKRFKLRIKRMSSLKTRDAHQFDD